MNIINDIEGCGVAVNFDECCGVVIVIVLFCIVLDSQAVECTVCITGNTSKRNDGKAQLGRLVFV